MIRCPNCGEENPDRFRLCGFCGTALHAPSRAPEVRKTVSIVFCDLVGSTDLGDRLDSEAVREVVGRYFDAMQDAIERHGGTVEKFIGDAVMAVFGLPTLHEDDALRAVRAAVAMRDALGELNVDLEARAGVRLANRTGVNTGEVVAGDPSTGQRLVTGDPVNVAARLEQAAGHGEILIGELTERLVRGHVVTEELAPLTLKGKPDPVPAHRLVALREASGSHAGSPLVGRDAELASILDAFAEARDSGSARMVTVIGDPGVGKSRLTGEACARLAPEARVLTGRCLPYGRGITFWPLAELVQEAAGISETDAPTVAVQRLHALAGGDSAVQRRVASAIGLTTEQFPVEELFWGARELLAGLARERPLVAIFEDLHWAELTFLELLQHVADSARAPILLLGTARRDVLDLRPGWCERAGERLIPLAPLEGDALATVIDAQLGGALAPAVRERIVAAASGNPLFAEQLVSMLVDEGRLQRRDDGWVAADGLDDLAVPPTIQALLGARLDQLPRPERDVIEPASVVGVEFEVAAVRALLDAPAPVDPQLADLERKQLVNRIDEAAYAFEHILLRDTAYGRLLKRVRADLHVRFVRWAEEVYTARGGGDELAEVLGYHLEQAHRYLAELGPLDDEGRALGTRAAARLAVAGRRAFNREDMPAAANLLRRAATLLGPDDPRRLPLLLPLGEAFEDVGDFPVAAMFLEEAIEQAEAIGDAATAALARVARLLVEGQSGGADVGERIIAAATDAIPRLADAENHAGLAAAWRAQAWVHGTAGRFGRTAAAAERAVFHATRAGDDRQRRRAAVQYAVSATYGPTPVPEAIERCEAILEAADHDRRTSGLVRSLLSRLVAMGGDIARGRALYRDAQRALGETGRTLVAASTSLDSCGVEMLAGDPEAAERELRRDHELLTAMDEHYMLSTVSGELARVLVAQGRTADAWTFSREAEALAASDDVASQVLWRLGRARLLSANGRRIAARELAEEAVELLVGTDARVTQAEALMDLAEILRGAGELSRAESTAREALALCNAKGNVVAAEAARRWIGALASVPAQRM